MVTETICNHRIKFLAEWRERQIQDGRGWWIYVGKIDIEGGQLKSTNSVRHQLYWCSSPAGQSLEYRGHSNCKCHHFPAWRCCRKTDHNKWRQKKNTKTLMRLVAGGGFCLGGRRPIGQRLLAVLLVLKGVMLSGWHQKKLVKVCKGDAHGWSTTLQGELHSGSHPLHTKRFGFSSPSLPSWFRNEIPSLFVSSAEKLRGFPKV